jgi:hypothetical protein
MKTKIETGKKLKRVRQGELGLFISLLDLDPMTTGIIDIAKEITDEFNVDCRPVDIEKFCSIDNWEDNFEVESKKIEYYE